MNLFSKKRCIKKLIYFVFLNLFIQTNNICFASKQFTVYGTVAGNEYQREENHLSYYSTKAFPGDGAYSITIKYGKKNFCVNQEAIPHKAQGALRIMSFNVHNFHKICVANGELFKNPKYAADAIKKIDPDIVALEEVVPYAMDEQAALKHDSNGLIIVNFSVLDKLMHDMDFTNNIKVNDFEKNPDPALNKLFMGKAIYTKTAVPIKAFSNSQIGQSPNNDRGYVSILFEYDGKLILLYDVHLTFFNDIITTTEIVELTEVIKKDQEKFGTKNVIIVGDFNNNSYSNPKIFEQLEKSSFTLLNDMSPTAFNQNVQIGETIDLIYVSKDFLENFEILNKTSNNPEGKKVVVVKSDESDHWPVFFDFKPKKNLDESVNAVFDLLKKDMCNKALLNFNDVEINKTSLDLPVSVDIKSQSLSQIRIYKNTDIVDKKILYELLTEVEDGYLKFIKEQNIKDNALVNIDKDYLFDLVLNILNNEIKLNKEYYVAYHAHKPEYTFLFDVFQQIYKWGLLNNAQQLGLRLIRPCNFNDSEKSMDDFLNQVSLLNRNEIGEYEFDGEKHKYLDQTSKTSSLLLSLNLSLFANMKNFGASSMILGLSGKSFRHINIEEILLQVLKDCNIGEEFVPKILRLKQQYLSKQKRGVLLQFFIKKDIINKFMYLSNVGGRPFNEKFMNDLWDFGKERVNVSNFLEKFINTPQELNLNLKNFIDKDQKYTLKVDGKRSLTQLQARLWMPAKEIYDSNFVLIKRYNFDQNDYVDKEYYLKLNEIFEEIVKDLIRKKFIMEIGNYDLTQTPFEAFERKITPLIEEESKKNFNDIKHINDIFSILQIKIDNLIYEACNKKIIDNEIKEKIKKILTSSLYQTYKENFVSKNTPLMMAIKMKNADLVDLLLSIEGYDPELNAKNINGQTAIYLAKMNLSNVSEDEIWKMIIKYLEQNINVFDSMHSIDMAILSKIDSIRTIILKKFEEKLLQVGCEIISMGRELIKNAKESELSYLSENIFDVCEKSKNPRIQSNCLTLLKFIIMRENLVSDVINKALNYSFMFYDSKILIVKKSSLDLQNAIGKRFIELYVGIYREKNDFSQELIYKADVAEIEKIYINIKKMINSNSFDLQEAAIIILDSIIRNYKSNKQIIDYTFLVIKKFINTEDVLRQIDLLGLIQPLIYFEDKYELQIKETVPIFIKNIYKNLIESNSFFNNLQTWQQKKMLNGTIGIIEYLINKKILDDNFLEIAEKIVEKIRLQNKE